MPDSIQNCTPNSERMRERKIDRAHLRFLYQRIAVGDFPLAYVRLAIQYRRSTEIKSVGPIRSQSPLA